MGTAIGSPLQRKPFEGKHSELSQEIIRVFYEVHSELGYGFSEKVYQKALGVPPPPCLPR